MDIISPTHIASIEQFLLQDCCAQNPQMPVIYAMAGVPGAGKSTFVQQAIHNGLFPKQAFLLNPDVVLRHLPEFLTDRDILGEAAAATKWEFPARKVAMELLQKAIDKKIDIIVDMGQVRQENWDVLVGVKQNGYKVHLYPIFTELNECVNRLLKRAEQQYFPPAFLIERAESLAKLLTANLTVPDEVKPYHTCQNQFIPCENIQGWIEKYAYPPFDLFPEKIIVIPEKKNKRS